MAAQHVVSTKSILMDVLLILSPSCFAACCHFLSPRITIVFSLVSTVVYQLPPCHICLYAPSLLSTHPVPPCTFHIILLCEFYSLLFYQTGASVHLLPPPPGSWYTSFIILAGPGHLHQIAVARGGLYSRGEMYSISCIAVVV